MKNIYRRLLCLLIITLLFLTACRSPEEITTETSFQDFLTQIFVDEVTSDTISLHYTLANPENYGITEDIQTLGTYSSIQMKENLLKIENQMSTLQSYDYETLTEEEQLIYDILMLSFSQSVKMGNYVYHQEILGPTTGLQAQLPILLAEYSFYDEQDIKTYLGMLSTVPDYFSQISTFEQEKSKNGFFMTDEVADRIIMQCSDFIAAPEDNFLIEVFDDKVSAMTELTQDEIILYQEENRTLILNKVIPAYQALVEDLNELKGTGKNASGLSGFEQGKEFYELMVQMTTGSPKTVEEMKTALNNALNDSRATMTTIALTNSSIYEEYTNLSFPSSNPEEIILYLKEAVKRDFPYLEDVNCNIKYVHESLQDHLSPAMYLVPPIDYYTENNIYINNNPEYDMGMIFPTIAHEGYPGHLYQNVYFRQGNPNPIRNIINVTGYDEGWATYVELYSYDLANLSEDLVRFLKANTIALHCLYSLTDIGIHYEGWTKSYTAKYWSSFGIDSATAEDIYYTILAEPGIYLPYSVGYLELMELRNQAETVLGSNFNLKDFHEFFLGIGPAPYSVVKKYMEEWLSTK